MLVRIPFTGELNVFRISYNLLYLHSFTFRDMDQESPLSDLVSRLALALDYPDGSDAGRNLGLAKVTTFQD